MANIRSSDTRPEMTVRRLLHSLGFRYRLHRRDLAGKPDLVFASRRKVIFVHGCFWHQHSDCREGRMPGSNREYWTEKLGKNIERDARNRQLLEELGWSVLVVWECELIDITRLNKRLLDFLNEVT